MPEDLQQILSAASNMSAGANAGNTGVTGVSSASNRTQVPNNPVLEALTERLLKQTQGVSSSASSELQRTINDAMKSTERAGNLTTERLQSERGREVAFARDRAGATYTQALEGRTGYGTQVAALRELTETTEKSVRDLDKRYQEAILANDSATAQRMADLKVQKLQFQMEQEQNFFNNLMSVANLTQQQAAQQMQNEQFWVTREQEERQFIMNMAQSQYQFQKNLGIQYKELDLKSQELDLQRERNSISRAEYNLKAAELQKAKQGTTIQAQLQQRILNARKSGVDYSSVDPLADANSMYAEILQSNPNFDMDQEDFASLYMSARTDAMSAEIPAAPMSGGRSQFSRDLGQFTNYLRSEDSSWISKIPMLGLGREAFNRAPGVINYFTRPTQ